MIRRITFFYLFFFLFYSYSYALPFLGVIPFVFELGVLIYAFSSILFTGIILYLFKNIKLYNYILFFFVVISAGSLLWLIQWNQFSLIHISFTVGNLQYIHLLIAYTVSLFILYIFFLLFKKNILIFPALILSAYILVINLSLLHSTILLNTHFNSVIEYFNQVSDNTLIETNSKIRNNIFISQDFSYQYQGEKKYCRITMSYYIYEGKPYQETGKKGDTIQLYTGLDNGLCRDLLSPIYHEIK